MPIGHVNSLLGSLFVKLYFRKHNICHTAGGCQILSYLTLVAFAKCPCKHDTWFTAGGNKRLERGINVLNELKWNDWFNIGVNNIDKAHQRLFSIVSKLLNLNEDTAKQQHACREGIKYFKSYALKHFAEEEAYMQSIHYGDYDIHKRLHDNMRDKTIPALEEELEAHNYSVESVQHFLGICIGWLNGHILIEDYSLTGRVSKKWVHQASENEIDSLQKAISQTLEKLFRIKAQLMSDHYSGEDFSAGSQLCYRLLYYNLKKEPIQIYMIYEQQMILNILSGMLDKQITKVDKTVMYTFKMLSQKLMECVGKHFVLNETYQLEKIDIMTFEQLTKSFEKQYPSYSLLFNTKRNGYFAFCIKQGK